MSGSQDAYVMAEFPVIVQNGGLQLRGSFATAFIRRCVIAARGFVTTEICADQDGVRPFGC